MNTDEDIIVTYHRGVEFLAKISLMSNEAILKLQDRLKREAIRSNAEGDSVALRILSNAAQVYITEDNS